METANTSIAKITRPSASGISPRERVYRLMDSGMRRPAIWISAPAGAGKTSLVAGYLASRNLPCLWYQVDEGDADITTFFYYFGLAVENASPDVQESLPHLNSEYLQGVNTFTRRYFERIYKRFPPHFILVFDEYQNVHPGSGFHRVLCEGMANTPEGVTIIIISRWEPPPVFARMRANGRIFPIGWNELRFNLEESRGVVAREGRRQLSDTLMEALHYRTRGWAAGLVLVSERARTEEVALASIGELSKEGVFDYFSDELFEKVSRDMQEFLLKTAFLPSMTAHLAEQLTGVAASGKNLSYLCRNHFFTEMHAQDSPVYQYHPLFREFLINRAKSSFSPQEVSRIQQDAATLLVEARQVEDALMLLDEAEDWQGFLGLVLSQARTMLAQGRGKTVETWLENIPGALVEKSPWALFWLGVCKQLRAPIASRQLFERAFQIFLVEENSAGIFLSWAGGVDTFLYECDDFTPLSRWIERLDELMRRHLPFPTADIEARVAASMAGALILSRPHHPDIKEWIERALVFSRVCADSQLRVQVALYAFNYYLWTGDIVKSGMIVKQIEKIALSPDTSPQITITHLLTEALFCNWSIADPGLATELVAKGLETSRASGLHFWDHFLIAQGVYGALNKGDTDTAGNYLKKMAQTLQCSRGLGLCLYSSLSTWHNLALGKASQAVAHGETAVRFFAGTGSFGEILHKIQLAQALYAANDHKQAIAHLSGTRDPIRQAASLTLEYMYLLTHAQFALDRGDETAGTEYLRQGMTLGRKQGYCNMLWWWLPKVMTMLCSKALEAGIEVEYVQDLIRKRKLIPDGTTIHMENWPWPIRIYTLGRFGIIKDGVPLTFTGKVQQKPLALLKALISLGGREVAVAKLVDLLWADSEGDVAYQSFTTNLHRLRRLLGNDKAIRANEGKVTLNASYCWLDVWAFERLAGAVKTIWQDVAEKPPSTAVNLIKRVMMLYTGHFLSGDPGHSWAVSMRERLRSKVLHLVGKAGACHECHQDWTMAVEYYVKGLDIDDHIEEFYQGLMICHHRLGRPGEALAAYARCRKILATIGAKPSERTRAIHEALLDGTAPEAPQPLPVFNRCEFTSSHFPPNL